ncbi:hypothetical protein JNW88_22385 [Micromonospora sp. ATA32]|nr:hypothetical protein [Micromonospora sp. ATA32]
MRHPIRPRAYVAGPALATRELAAAVDVLATAGYLVTSATATDPGDPDALVADVADDLDAARAADVVVTLPSAEDFPEPVYAALFGVPVVTLGEALAVAR